MSKALGEYQGRPIVGFGIIVRNAGDGLSQAMAVEPMDIQVGDEVYLLVEAKCVDVHHPAEDPKYPEIGGVRKIPVLRAGTATFIDGEQAAGAIERQREANREYADRQSGQVTISAAILRAEHDDGQHKKRREGCEQCDEEARLEEAEKAEAEKAKAAADQTGGDEVGAKRRSRSSRAKS